MSSRIVAECGRWLKRNARAVHDALTRGERADRDLARELDRMLTLLVGEYWRDR